MPTQTRRSLLRSAALLAGVPALRPLHLFAQSTAGTSTDAVLSTPAGQLRGTVEQGIRVFRGVPFAQPPVGPLRFRRTEPLKPWTGVRDATRFASAAIQKPEPGVATSEDCLYLNVWAPSSPGPHPVFVWIHGGGFTGGDSFASIFDGTSFAQAGIVLVTVAYRLGVFGFMDVEPLLGPAYADSANNGTRDLIQALHWVHTNIAAFGGNPAAVTVGGESAGAKVTAALLAIPEATALFHSAISESGGGERVLSREQAHQVAQDFSACRASGSAAEPFLTAPPASLLATQERLLQSTAMHFPFREQTGGALLAQRPVDLVAAGSSRGKRLLIGSNRDESALFLGPHPKGPVKQSDLGNMPLDLFQKQLEKYPSLYPDMAESQRLIRAVTAEEYWIPTIRLADAHLRNLGETWLYRLDFTPDSGRFAGEAFHSEDLGFVWNKLSPAEQQLAAAQQLASQMHTCWINFIQGSAPTAPGLPAWPRYNTATRPTMLFDRVSTLSNDPAGSELNAWKGWA